MKKKYLLVVWGNVNPEIMGPFKTETARDKKARAIRKENGDDFDDGIFMLEAEGRPGVFAYSGRFFEQGNKP